MTAPSQAVERFSADGVTHYAKPKEWFVRATDYDALTARVRELEAALVVAVPRMAHRIGCYRGRPTEEWEQHGSASFDGCECEIKQARAALSRATGSEQ